MTQRVVLCVEDPWNHIEKYDDYSLMIVNPDSPPARLQYLLDKSDYSLFITKDKEVARNGKDYPDEKIFAYTSGTTGDSKFYSFSTQQIQHCCQQIINGYKLTANDRYVGIMPLWHAHGQAFYFVTQMLKCEANFLPITKLSSLSSYHPTFISAIPDIINVLSRQTFDCLRFVRTASSALSVPLYNNFVQKFKVPIIEAFGMTETYSQCFSNPLYGEQRPGTIGLPTGVEAKIVNGHLHLKGPGAYCSDWFDTLDLAEQDSAGYYKILGRSQDRLNIRGFKLDPLSLEIQMREKLPDLKELAIFGVDSVKCVYSGPYTEIQIAENLNMLGQHCRPSLVKQLEEIPKNNSGKISRKYLNSLY
jgi:acyl-coenzyme A synthetase/AMP-(fatty) acid ligase